MNMVVPLFHFGYLLDQYLHMIFKFFCNIKLYNNAYKVLYYYHLWLLLLVVVAVWLEPNLSNLIFLKTKKQFLS